MFSTLVAVKGSVFYGFDLFSFIFILLAVLRQSAQRVAGFIPASRHLGDTALKKRHSYDEPLPTLCPIRLARKSDEDHRHR